MSQSSIVALVYRVMRYGECQVEQPRRILDASDPMVAAREGRCRRTSLADQDQRREREVPLKKEQGLHLHSRLREARPPGGGLPGRTIRGERNSRVQPLLNALLPMYFGNAHQCKP